MDIEIKLLLKETAYNMVSELLLLKKNPCSTTFIYLGFPKQLSPNLFT